MSSDDDNHNDYYIDAITDLTPLPPGSTGTPPGYVPQTTPAPQLSQQRAMPSTTRTDFATSGYRQRAPSVGAPVRRNLSGQINHAASGQVHFIDPNVATLSRMSPTQMLLRASRRERRGGGAIARSPGLPMGFASGVHARA